jgi:excisionase family DNA binding protein
VPEPPDRTPAASPDERRLADRVPGPRRGPEMGGGLRERNEPSAHLTASDVLTIGEVAELLHVPESTVGDWARRRVIPSLKLGRRRIFVRSKIEAIILADDE